jgi:hypothetical protein
MDSDHREMDNDSRGMNDHFEMDNDHREMDNDSRGMNDLLIVDVLFHKRRLIFRKE